MSATFQPDGAPPAKSTSTTKIVLIVLGVILLLGLLACGGMIAMALFGVSKFQEVAGEEFKKQLVGNPTLEQELGPIETVTFDFQESVKRTESDGNRQLMVLNVVGARGEGIVVAETGGRGGNQLVSATLETQDGRSIPLILTEGEEATDDVLLPTDVDTGDEDSADVDFGDAESSEVQSGAEELVPDAQ